MAFRLLWGLGCSTSSQKGPAQKWNLFQSFSGRQLYHLFTPQLSIKSPHKSSPIEDVVLNGREEVQP